MAKRDRTKKKLPNFPFLDGYGTPCSIQDSSATVPHIWLGVKGKDPDVVGVHMMHIDKETARFLIEKLEGFVRGGRL